jgi:hypothetical protein
VIVADVFDPKWLEAESEQMSKALAQLQPFLVNSYESLHAPPELCDAPIQVAASCGSKSKHSAKGR